MFSSGDIILLVFIIAVAIVVGLYFLNRWAMRKMDDQQQMITRTKQIVSIYVIDKKKLKAKESNLPKVVMEKLPRVYKVMKMPLVKAKIGPQIMTLMCDRKVFDVIPIKKNVKVELAGIYIVHMVGMKTEKEMKALAKAKGKGRGWLDVAKNRVTSVFRKNKKEV